MRILFATILVSSLVTTNLFAAEVTGPLAPGKASGVQKAQDEDFGNLWWLAGGAAAIGIIVWAASGGSNPAPAGNTTTTTTTTST